MILTKVELCGGPYDGRSISIDTVKGGMRITCGTFQAGPAVYVIRDDTLHADWLIEHGKA
jgi:hypothetical protein